MARQIKIVTDLEVMRTGYLQIFCKKVGAKEFLIGTNIDTDILIRLPELATDISEPDNIIFKKGDRFKLIIESIEKKKE